MIQPDFPIDGYTDTEAHPESWAFFSPQTSSGAAGVLWLASPRFTPVAAGVVVPPSVSLWLLPYSSNYVAVMPFDDACLAAARKNAESRKYAFPAVLHVGPFDIRGQLLSEYENVSYLSTIANHVSLVVRDAEIEYRLPGPQFTGLKAPLVLVHTRLLQGIGLM